VASVGFSSAEPKVPDDKRTGPTLTMVTDPPRRQLPLGKRDQHVRRGTKPLFVTSITKSNDPNERAVQAVSHK
jgi:hypothetical protein